MAFEALAYIADPQLKTVAGSARRSRGSISLSQPNYDDPFLIWDANKPSSIIVFLSKAGKYVLAPQHQAEDNGDPARNISVTESVISPRDMIEKIRGVIGLNNVQIAEILRISRPSLYNHSSGKEAPKSIESYQRLYEIALRIERDNPINIKPGIKSFLVEGNTLLGHLRESIEDPEKINRVSSQIAERLAASKVRPTLTPEEQRKISREITRTS